VKPLLIHGFFVTGAVSFLIAQPAATQVVQETEQPLKQTSSNSFDAIANSPRLSQDSDKTDLSPLAPLPYKGMQETTSPLLAGEGLGERLNQKYSPLSETEFPLTRIRELTQQPRGIPFGITSLQANSQRVAQVSETVVQVMGVQLNPTDGGLELILETADGTAPQVTTSSYDQTLLIDISNARLNIPAGEKFYLDNPADGITSVTVTPLYSNSVRVMVIGDEAVPTAQVVQSASGLILSLTSDSMTAFQPTPPTPEASDLPLAETLPEEELIEPTTEELEPPELEDEEIEIIVTGDRESGYSVPNASTATRTDTPIRDIPTSIQVIPQQVLEDQNVLRLQDALQNVSGVSKYGNYGGTGAGSYNIRGFSQDGNFRNGFRDNDFYSLPETANIERVEVLKGPASVLFGQVEPGGIINIVTEQPLSEPYYSLGFEVGNYDFYRTTLDISGPLNSDKSLLYRLNVAYQNADSFRDFVETERVFIAPVVTWNISDRTTLTVDFEYLYDDPLYDRGLSALSDGSLVLPIERFLGYSSLDDYHQARYRGGFTFEHQFSDNWQLRNALAISSNRLGGQRTDVNGTLQDDRFIPRELRDDEFVVENYGVQTELTGNFDTGAIAHQLLLGFELSRKTRVYNTVSADLPLIDIFDPDYEISLPTELPNAFQLADRIDALGLYLQDQITLTDNLKLLVGGRFDFTDQEENYPLDGISNNQSDEAFSPRLGIVYQPIEPISLYASYSRSFVPVVGRSATNSPFVPQRGTQYEVGIKGEFFDGRLLATLAGYEITKTNVLTFDPADPDFSIQVGEQRSRGIELDVAGEILPGWNIIASYAHTDAEVTEDNLLPVGSRLANVPENSASLWTTYELQNGSLQGLGFGLGLFFVGDRAGFAGSDPPEFELPSYLRTDAAVYYRRNNWKAAINIKNLFGIEYYETHQGYDIVYPGAPFSVIGSFSIEF